MIRLPSLEEIAARWLEIEPILRRATSRTQGCYEPVDVLREAMAGRCAFWLIEDDGRLDGITVTEVQQYPRKRALLVRFVAGRRLADWWPEFVEMMDRIARQHDCAQIVAYGRPGWVRFWHRHGVATHAGSEIVVRELA